MRTDPGLASPAYRYAETTRFPRSMALDSANAQAFRSLGLHRMIYTEICAN